MTNYSQQTIDSVAPLGATTQVDVTQTSQAFALPSTAGTLAPSVMIESLQSGMQALFVKFGNSGAVTVSLSDGMKVSPGSPGKPTILGIPSGATHIAIICDGAPGPVNLTGAESNISVFAPNGAATNLTVNDVTQAVAIPATGSGDFPGIALVGLQSAQIAWWIKFGNSGAVTVSRSDGLKVKPGAAESPAILNIPSGATHFAIICEGPEGSVRLSAGQVTNATFTTSTNRIPDNAVTNAKLADMAAWTIKMRNAGTSGDPQDQTIAQLTTETVVDGLADWLPMWDTGSGTMDKVLPFDLAQAGGIQLLTSGTATNVPSLDIVLTAYTAYRSIRIFFQSAVPVTADRELQCRFSSNGGSSYDAGAGDYSWSYLWSRSNFASAVVFQESVGARIILCGSITANESVSNTASQGGANGYIELFGRTDGARKTHLYVNSTWFGQTVLSIFSNVGGGIRNAAQVTNAIQFFFESGNIASIEYAVYGVR